MLKCKHCKTKFTPKRSDALYCSPKCGAAASRAARAKKAKAMKNKPTRECSSPYCTNLTTNLKFCSRSCQKDTTNSKLWLNAHDTGFIKSIVRDCHRAGTVQILGVLDYLGNYSRLDYEELLHLYDHKALTKSANEYGYVLDIEADHEYPLTGSTHAYKWVKSFYFESCHIHPAVTTKTRGLLNSQNLVIAPQHINRSMSNKLNTGVKSHQYISVSDLLPEWNVTESTTIREVLELANKYLDGSLKLFVESRRLSVPPANKLKNNILVDLRKDHVPFYHPRGDESQLLRWGLERLHMHPSCAFEDLLTLNPDFHYSVQPIECDPEYSYFFDDKAALEALYS